MELAQQSRSQMEFGNEDRSGSDFHRGLLTVAAVYYRGCRGIALSVAVFGLIFNPLAQARDTIVGRSPGQAASQAAISQAATAATQATAQASQTAIMARRAQDSMIRSAAALQAAQAAQAAARSAAQAGPNHLIGSTDVPDGLAIGGLNPIDGATVSSSGPSLVNYNIPTTWSNVGALTQSTGGGSTTVTVTQTAPEALLHWTTFNISKNTVLNFNQNAASWVAVNQIHDPSLAPSQILGQINAPGQVYVINQNGIIFGGSSQVNAHALVASSLPINTNLLNPQLLVGDASTTQDQFLFSQLTVNGTGKTGALATFNPGNVVTVASSNTNSPTVTLASSILPADFGVGSLLLGSTVQSINGTTVTLAANANAGVSVPSSQAFSTTGGAYAVTVASSRTTSTSVTLASTALPAGFGVGSQLLGSTVTKISGKTVTLASSANASVANKAQAYSMADGDVRNDGSVVVQAGAQLNSPTTPEHVGGRIALIGPVVENRGTISTPDGQTILAAGLQVGWTAHAQTAAGPDPSLRGLDVFVGQVGGSNGTVYDANGVEFGTVTNNGVIEIPRADVTMTGKSVNQNGAVDSLTSVALNGRIDLLADYGTSFNATSLKFLPTQSGAVTLGPDSVTQILPDPSAETAVGLALPLPSLVNIEGQTIHLAAGAQLRAPGAKATPSALATSTTSATVGSVDMVGAALTSGVNLTAGSWVNASGANTLALSYNTGQVNIDSGATIDVAGLQDVTASVSENIVQAQLRGTELANSPLQQNGALRGQTVFIDIGRSGVYDGQAWIGSPIGDLSGYAGLVGHTASEFSVNGGTINIQAGNEVNLASGSTLNVSGGWINYQGGYVNTTKVVNSYGRRIDISQATPDQNYKGIYSGFTVSSAKWGKTETFNDPFVRSTTYDPGYLQGGNGGALTISTPSLSLGANVYGDTVAGINQVSPLAQYTLLNTSTTVVGLPKFANANFAGANFMPILIPMDAVPTASSLVLNLVPQSSVLVSVKASSTASPVVTLASATLPPGFAVGSTLLGSTVVGINGTTVTLATNANVTVATTTPEAFSVVANVASSSTDSPIVTLASASLPPGFSIGSQLLGSTVQSIDGTKVTLAANANATISGATQAYSTSGGNLVSVSASNVGSPVVTLTTSVLPPGFGVGSTLLGSTVQSIDGNTVTLATNANANVSTVSGVTQAFSNGSSNQVAIASSSTTSNTVTLASATLPSDFAVGSVLLGSTVQSINGTTVTLAANATANLTNANEVYSSSGGNVVPVLSSTITSPTVTLASATLPTGFGVGSQLLGSTVQSIVGTTVTLASNANATVAASTAEAFSSTGGSSVVPVISSSTTSHIVTINAAALPPGFAVGSVLLGSTVQSIHGNQVTLASNANTNISGTGQAFSNGASGHTVTVASSSVGSNVVTLASDALPPGFATGSLLLGSTVQSINGTTVTLASNANATVTNAGEVFSSLVSVAFSDTGSNVVTLASDALPPGFGIGSTLLGSTVTGINGTTVTLAANANASVLNSSEATMPELTGKQDVVFQSSSGPKATSPFVNSGNPQLDLSADLLNVDGFGNLTIDGNAQDSQNYNASKNTSSGNLASTQTVLSTAGNIALPAGVNLTTLPGGSVTLAAVNLDIESSISAPGGVLSFTAQNVDAALTSNVQAPLAPLADRGNFTLGNKATLSTAGLVVNNLGNTAAANLLPQAIDGGAITIKSFNANLQAGTSIDASGGAVVGSTGKITYGAGGKIDIEAGQDPYPAISANLNYGILGGQLILGSNLSAYSGKTGGSLSILAPAIQVGGSTLVNGDTSANPVIQQNSSVWGNGTTLWLDPTGSPDFFSQGGFSSFNLTGLGLAPIVPAENPYASTPGVVIASGTNLHPVVQSYTSTVDGNGVHLTPITQPLASQRTPVSLAFNAAGVNAGGVSAPNNFIVRGDLVMQAGATIETDPMGSVTLSGQTATVLGNVYAPGGTIKVSGSKDSVNLFQPNLTGFYSASDIAPTVDLGPGSVLSAAGTAEQTYNQFGYNTGNVVNGGSITISGNIVAETGSLQDVSGANATFDVLPASGSSTTGGLKPGQLISVPQSSNGGTITFNGGEELFIDSTLKGQAGGTDAQPGSLVLSNGFSNYNPTSPGSVIIQNQLDATLVVTTGSPTRVSNPGQTVIGSQVTPSNPLSDVNGNAILGYFAANSNIFASSPVDSNAANNGGVAGGIGSLSLNDTVQFSGPVSIATSTSLVIANNPSFTSLSDPTLLLSGGIVYTDSAVTLSSAYVKLGLPFTGPNGAAITPAVVSGPGALTVNASKLIDVGNFSPENSNQLNLNSGGDVRGDGALTASGNISIAAAQIYPTTESTFTIAAYNPPGGSSSVTLARSTNSLPAVPLSAGGILNVYAETITQGGVLRAPIGTINLGSNSLSPAAVTGVPATQQITLAAGSITSVSALDPNTGLGITIPYGSIDSNGNWTDPANNPSLTASSTPTLPAKSINVAGANIDDVAGSTLDISGGGDLVASVFNKGTGGTTDILASTTSFAILPSSNQAAYAPYDVVSGYNNASLHVGDQVYFSASNGLPAGYYTLLPARYALLPGAFLVTPKSGTTVDQAVTKTDGSSLVSGYRVSSLNSAREQSLNTLFEVDSQAVINSRAQYVTSSANDYFAKSATSLGVTAPRLPVDSGQLILKATQSLTLPSASGTLRSQPGQGGLGGIVDIATPIAVNIYSEGNTPQVDGALNLDAAGLTALNAGSLLIGGYRNSAGTLATVTTNSLTVNNQGGSELSANDLILASNGLLQVMPGSVITASSGSASTLPLAIGNGSSSVTVASSTNTSNVVTLASATLPPGFGVGSGLLGSTVQSINGSTVTLTSVANANISSNTDTTFLTSDGALVRVSNTSTNSISRPYSIDLADAAPQLVIGNANLSGGSLALDSTGFANTLDSNAILSASGAISISSGKISLVLDGSQAASGLVLSGEALATLQSSAPVLSLASYSSLDIWGGGTIGAAIDASGNYQVQSLSLHAAEIRGFDNGGQTVSINAQNVFLDNRLGGQASGATQATTAGSTLAINAGTVSIGVNALAIDQYADVAITAANAVVLENGTGSLSASGNLTVATPLVTASPIGQLTPLQELNGVQAANSSAQTIRAGGMLTVNNSGGSVPVVSEGLGASLTLAGASVVANSTIQLPSGSIEIVATQGDLNVGGQLDVRGTRQNIYALSEYTPGGQINLTSYRGNVNLNAGSNVDVSGPAGSGKAGSLAIRAPDGLLAFVGSSILGQGAQSGVFSLDVGNLSDLDALGQSLNSGGFHLSRTIRARTGDLTLNETVTAQNFSLSTDEGSITVNGEIDASGATGGSITLQANGDLTLASGSLLTVEAKNFSDAGKGGSITLQAGAETNGVAGNGSVSILAGSTLNLTVDANNSAAEGGNSAALGHFNGTVEIEAPRIGESDVRINPIQGNIIGASNISIVANQVYSTDAAGDINGNGADLPTQVMTDGNNFLGAAGTASANYTAIMSRLFNGAPPANASLSLGAEIINPNGDLTLANNWDLSTFRFGPNSSAGDLTLRASGNLIFNFGASLSDGFTANPNSTLAVYGLWSDVLMPVGSQSWSYRLISGADFSAADYHQVLPGIPTNPLLQPSPDSLSANSGSLVIGLGAPGLPTGAALSTWQIMSTFSGGLGFYQTIRTGTGNIDIASGSDVQLLNNVATVYTAGTQTQPSAGLDVPILLNPTDDANNQNYNFSGDGVNAVATAQYSQAGGNVTISAQGNIAHYVPYDRSANLPIVGYDLNGNPLMDDSSKELPTNWLYRRGYSSGTGFGTDMNNQVASTSWWIDFSNFFEGVGALGGGNVTLKAAGSINNVDAVVPTNAYMTSRDVSTLVETGGGDLQIQAGNNINGGVYYVERGQGTLYAGGQITTNATRNVDTAGSTSPLTYLPTTFFLGKGNLDISSKGDLLMGPVVNPFLLPQGLNNTIYDKSYFSTYASTDTVAVTSYAGKVTVKDGSSSDSLLIDFYADQTSEAPIPAPPTTNFTRYEPWLGLVETNPGAFLNEALILPSTLQVVAFSGDINLVGDLTLAPSATGNLNLVAAGSVNAFQPNSVDTTGIVQWQSARINLSDADPGVINGITAPISYVNNSQLKVSLQATNTAPLAGLNNSLFKLVSGSTTGASAQLATQLALHADLNGPLHANDLTPLHVYAGTGNIDGLNLFSGKSVNVVAGTDIENVSFYVQNVSASDISLIEAGRDITGFNKSSLLREESQVTGGMYSGQNNLVTPDGTGKGLPNAGDFQIAGPGTLEVLAGRDLNLGQDPIASDNIDGTHLGVVSIGNTLNPSLATSTGADVIAAGGLGGSSRANANLGAAGFGLDASHNSLLDFAAFEDQFLNPGTGGSEAARYLPVLGSLLGLTDATSSLIWDTFNALPVENKDATALTVFYDVLRDAGRDHNNPDSPDAGTYTQGYKALAALFPASDKYQGDITMTAREIKTTNGGNINLLSPGGGVDLGTSDDASQAVNQGILTVNGGNISIFSRNNVAVGNLRIFTLHGGSEIIWSTLGNIAAGASSKTVQSVPPTRVLVDPQSGNVETDLAGLATGGGIGVLQTIVGAAPGDVDLIAPSGVVDAGDAGIRSSGNINIAATQVLNASNIQAGGSSSGVSAPVSSNISATVAASTAGGSSQNAATEAARQQQQHNEAQTEDTPSIISVTVVGYGGGDE